MYGRRWVLHICNVLSLAFSLGCAFAPNTATLLVFRLLGELEREHVCHFPSSHILAGFSGSAPVGIGGGSVGDLFSERDRASAMAVWTLGPLIGISLFLNLTLRLFTVSS
jgi:MFS family permease